MSRYSSMPQGTVEPLGSSEARTHSGGEAAHNSDRLQASYPGCPTFNDYLVDEVVKLQNSMRFHAVNEEDQAGIQEYYGFAVPLGAPYENAPNISADTLPTVELPSGGEFKLPSSYVPVLVPPSNMTPTADNIDPDNPPDDPGFSVTRRFVEGKTSRPPFAGPGNPKNPAQPANTDVQDRNNPLDPSPAGTPGT